MRLPLIPIRQIVGKGVNVLSKEQKTCIGVISCHDDEEINRKLVNLFNELYKKNKDTKDTINKFQFIFTGGTYDRIVLNVDNDTREFLLGQCGATRLPGFRDGGVTTLSYFITQRLCSILWTFLAPKEHHLRRPENLAQMRLCDQWNVKRLMNVGSVGRWAANEANGDETRNLQPCPVQLVLREGAKPGEVTYFFEKNNREGYYEIKKIRTGDDTRQINNITDEIKARQENFPQKFEDMTIALIAHNEMKKRMISFAIDHEWELRKFGTILATGTTGREVAAATSRTIEKKIYRYHSGPKGGDIEIATEILFGRCHIVIFFMDPLNPHPHIDDIRTVFEACMIRDQVLMITNEMHAREFMSRVVRGKEGF